LTLGGTLTGTTVQAATIGNTSAVHIGNGAALTSLTGANVSGTVSLATTSTYVTGLTASNVTTALTYTPVNRAGDTNIGGALTPNANATVNLGGTSAYWATGYFNAIQAPSITGVLQTAAQTGITLVGTLTGLTLSGTLTGTTIQAATIGNASAVHTGATYTATSSFNGPHNGTLGSAGGNTAIVSTLTATGNTTVSALTVNNSATVSGTLGLSGITTTSAVIQPNANASVNLGTNSLWWNNVYAVSFQGVSTTAQYADLAENYSSDAEYTPGTVLVFGGTAEVTQSTKPADNRVAGVVSTNPAYLMNSALTSGVSVALVGRVPCNVIGTISKGDMLVTSAIPGVATSAGGAPSMGTVIGKALQNYNSTEVGTIEIAVGRQ
jgi:hypothetical protein